MLMKAGQKKERNLSRRRRESKDQDWARRTRKWNYTCKRTKTKARQDGRGWKAASEI